MLTRLRVFGLLSVLVLGLGACAPAEEPAPVELEEEAPAPPPSPTLYELTEVAITEEMPEFTSRNVAVLGVTAGDTTLNVTENLGEQFGDTIVAPQDYLTVYQDGGVVLYTFKQTGIARRVEVTTEFADQIADPNLKEWLENGEQSILRQWMGPEEDLENVPENNNATEFAYDSRGLRFVQYFIDGQDYYAIRFSQLN
jgi:hypothetical protein